MVSSIREHTNNATTHKSLFAIKDSDNNIIFDEDNIGTSTFEVAVSGKVKVQIDADNHKGSFKIQ